MMIIDKRKPIVIFLCMFVGLALFSQNNKNNYCWMQVDTNDYFLKKNELDSLTSISEYYYKQDSVIYLREFYYKGKLYGNRIVFYKNGQIQRIEMYNNGIIVGPFYEYDYNGKLIILGNYNTGSSDSTIREYEGDNEYASFDNPGVYSTKVCYSSPRQGRWTFYYDNGKKYLEGEYLNNERIGIWLVYDANTGKVMNKLQYKKKD